ncbi:MAG: lipid biosynthesis lauroyl acyltransferase [Deltaproteobacteria bacterium]|nr:lipid biosynthesis lauroyl acyltransferase [Deltaproteobacteria bacterium]
MHDAAGGDGIAAMKEKFARILLRLLEAIPLPLLAVLCEGAMSLVWAIDRKHRRIGRINLRIAFPEMDDGEARRIVRRCYQRMGTSAAEFIHLPKMDGGYIREHFRIEGLDHLRESMERQGRPAMAMTGHFGNWELLSHVYGSVVAPAAFIVRPLKSPILDAIVTERRECVGNTVIRKAESAKEVMKFLRRKVLVGILIDQNVDRNQGILVDFFTRKAYTTYGIARLAIAMRAAVHPGFIFRDPSRKFHHVLRFGPAIPIDYGAPREEEVPRVTRRCNEELEKAIREAPDQWMWFQPRWKTRHGEEPDVYKEER